MSAHIEWGSARYTYIHGTATPGEIQHGEDSNATAAMQITFGSDGDALVIEGRPEDLVALFRGALDTAQAILMETVRSPELRRMYGEMAEAEASQDDGTACVIVDGVGDPDDCTTHAHEDVSQGGTDSVGLDFQACKRADRHVRSTRHGRLECPFVKDVDVDFPPGDDPMPDLNPHDRAWHQDGGRCVRANTTHDCLGNHRYGVTFEESR